MITIYTGLKNHEKPRFISQGSLKQVISCFAISLVFLNSPRIYDCIYSGLT